MFAHSNTLHKNVDLMGDLAQLGACESDLNGTVILESTAGMTDIPACWGLPNTNHASTEVDMARYDVKSSLGLQVDNATKMFLMECAL